MSDYFTLFKDWMITMGENHGVNPLFLGSLYLMSKVFFFSFLGWVFKNIRAGRPFVFPLLLASISFSIPYMYLIIAGHSISVWVYVFISALFSYGAFSIWKTVSSKQAAAGGTGTIV